MIVAIHQLHYLPWIRYFHKMVQSDIFVVLDNIQYNKNGWQNRNKIKNPQGWMYLTVPVVNKFQQNLTEVKINNTIDWRKKHWKSLLMNYSSGDFFEEHKSFFNGVYEKEWEGLNDLNFEILQYLIQTLGIKAKIINGSELDVQGEATQRLVNICKAVGGDSYLSGAYAAEAYLDKDLFKKENISLKIQDWQCPKYKQQFMKAGFIPDLSIVDLLFNEGGKSFNVIRGS